MNYSWSWIQLTEIIEMRSGGTPSKSNLDFWTGKIPWISAKDMKRQRLYDSEDHISEDGLKTGSRLAPRGSTLLLVRGMTLLTDVPICSVEQDCAFNQDVKAIVAKQNVDQRFLTYALLYKKPEMLGMVELAGHGTGRLPTDLLLKMLIPYPPLPEQRAIAAVLSALDDKIELNRQMNKTLEAMAQAIFKEWFVDFGPFRDGGMQDSELGPIPVGWRIVPLDQTANFLNGLALQKYPAVEGQPYLPVIKIREMRQGISEATDKASTKVPNAYVINDGDLLFSWSGSLEIIYWTGGPGALNQHLFKVTSTEFPSWFCYQWILEHLSFFRTIAASKATTMGHIQRKHLSEVKAIVPDSDSLKMMHSIMQPICGQRILLDLENKTLSTIRDTLLPKLMSGELRVPVDEEPA